MNITLYYAPISCALVPYVMMTEAQVDFELRTINLRKKEHLLPDYVKINPKHKVPLLVVDGQTLSENAAMQMWLDARFPQAKILPHDHWQKAQAMSILSWCSAGIHPSISIINSPAKVCSVAGTEDNVSGHAREIVEKNFTLAEDMLQGREFFFNHFTAADAHFFWCFRRCGFFDMDLSRFENCNAHAERMRARPSVQKLLALDEKLIADFNMTP